MPRNIDLLLDELLVDLEYQLSHENVEPSILHGLLGNVAFHPWKGFQKIVDDAIVTIETFSEDDLEEVKASLHQARKFISRARRKHVKCLNLEKERKARYFGKTSDGGSLNTSQSLQCGEERSKTRRSTEERSQTMRSKPNPWYGRKPVTNSSSIDWLHSRVVDTLKEFLELMYSDKDLRIDQRSISCGNLLDGASDTMIQRFMEKLISQASSSPEAENRSTARVKVNAPGESANDSANKGNKFGKSSNTWGETPIPPLENMNAQVGSKRSPKVDDPGNETQDVPLRPVIPLNQTPALCLFHNTIEQEAVIPVCCYELKAPILDLSGVLSESKLAVSTVLSHSVGSANENPTRMPVPPSSRPSQQFMNAKEVTTGTIGNVVKQDHEIVDKEDDMYITGATAQDVADSYNKMFSFTPSSKARGEIGHSRRVILPIAQVICQAILSKTGCAFLTNHQMSFALRVVEHSEEGGFGAKVYVTGAISPNEEPGQVVALVGFTKFCLDLVANCDSDTILNPMRRLMMDFSYKAYHAQVPRDTLSRTWCPGDLGSGEVVRTPPRSKMDEKLMMTFATSTWPIATGASGNVIKGAWEGVEVAAKLWNGHKREGFLNLRNEIEIYKRLQAKREDLLGSAVPRFLLGWDRPDEHSVYRKELILITEFVGSAISRRKGSLYLSSDEGIVIIHKCEEPSICEAALSSLRELHNNGFIHGDVALRNMRVSKSQKSERVWKVWWLDLGQAFEAHSAARVVYSQAERQQCQALFGVLV